jgi:hypothetical protein
MTTFFSSKKSRTLYTAHFLGYDMPNEVVLKWTCEKCGKVLLSLYEAQLAANIQSHQFRHREKNNSQS